MVPCDDTTVLGCRFVIHSQTAPTILYFHGSAQTVNDFESSAEQFIAAGFNIFLATYRGYGWSSGTPSASKMMSDSLIVYQTLKKTMQQMEIDAPLFVMGRSLGSAAAIEVCSQFHEEIRGLIIESGFARTLPLLASLNCDIEGIALREDEGFGNLEKIEAIEIPTLFLHGSLDRIIPIAEAERLQAFSGARTKKFFVIPGAEHGNVSEVGGDHYHTTLKDFIDEVTGASSWRQRRRQYKDQKKT